MPHDRPRSVQLEFSNSVESSTPVNDPKEVLREVPFDGYTSKLTIGWPDGTDNGTGVGLNRRAGENFFPWNQEDEFVAANDFTHAFDLTVPVESGEELAGYFVNTDDSNAHFVNVILTVVEHGHEVQPVSIIEGLYGEGGEVPPNEESEGPYSHLK